LTGITLFGSAVAVCIGTVAASSVLHVFGKKELATHLDAVAQLAMLGITMAGIYLVLAMLMHMFGISIPVGFDAVDKVFTIDPVRRWW